MHKLKKLSMDDLSSKVGEISFQSGDLSLKVPPGIQEMMSSEGILKAKLDFAIKKLSRPIGLAVFPNGAIALSDTGDNNVKLFHSNGKKMLF